MVPRIGFVSTSLLLAMGCGGPGSFNGEVSGHKLVVNDAVFAPFKDHVGIIGVYLVMSDGEELCTDLKANRVRRNTTAAGFNIFRTHESGSGTFLSPDKRTYTVVDILDRSPPPAAYTYCGFRKIDENCNYVLPDSSALGQSGTVDVESIAFENDGWMTGEFDVIFGTQNDRVTGSFNASYCDATLTLTTPNCE